MSLIIFESQLAQLEDNGIDIESYKGKKVNVVGTVTQYNSQLELILSSGDDIKMVWHKFLILFETKIIDNWWNYESAKN